MNPIFDDTIFHQDNINPDGIETHIKDLTKCREPISHERVLSLLLKNIAPIDFKAAADLSQNENVKNNHYQIITVEKVLSLAKSQDLGICRYLDNVYLFNGAYWSIINAEEIKSFLGEAAEKMGVDKYRAQYFSFRKQLYEQFLTLANLTQPEKKDKKVLINLLNGTFEISPEKQFLRSYSRNDFLTYQLPFGYNPLSAYPQFQAYLDKVLPDRASQMVLAEYIGYLFIQSSTLKLEKVLLLYGSGANGKSVLFEIVNALLGDDNVSSYSLQQLTDRDKGGPYRAQIVNKLVNYASEINGNSDPSLFKAMVSGEPIDARALYGQPYKIKHYAKLMFNCNELPTAIEQNTAYFRRFLIIPFEVQIPHYEQDPELSRRIIQNELSGIFNWVLKGLERLLKQKKFTECTAAQRQLEQYKLESDSVGSFMHDEGYHSSTTSFIPQKDLFQSYVSYCKKNLLNHCPDRNFGKRLNKVGYKTQRKAKGMAVLAVK